MSQNKQILNDIFGKNADSNMLKLISKLDYSYMKKYENHGIKYPYLKDSFRFFIIDYIFRCFRLIINNSYYKTEFRIILQEFKALTPEIYKILKIKLNDLSDLTSYEIGLIKEKIMLNYSFTHEFREYLLSIIDNIWKKHIKTRELHK